MDTNDQIKVELISPEEADLLFRRIKEAKERRETKPPKTLVFGIPFELTGEVELTCRDATSGETEWHIKQPNLITDEGRRRWQEAGFYTMQLMFGPITEPPDYRRYSLATPASGPAANLSPTVNSTLKTKTYSTTFGTPGSNRTLGTIALGGGLDGTFGMADIFAYTLLTPTKTQTTTQTLEVIYKVTFNPIV